MKFKLSCNCLIVASVVLCLFGLFIALLKETSLFAVVLGNQLDKTFWKEDMIQSGTIVFKNFTYSLIGILMLIWGVQLFFIVKFSFMNKQKWAWLAILLSTILWFILDESFSMYYGVYLNAILNLPFFVLIIIPLILSYNIFFEKNNN